MKTTLACTVLLLVVAVTGAGQAPNPPQQGRDAMVTLPSGLKYVDLGEGTGAEARKGQTVRVHFIVRLKDGTPLVVLDRVEPFSFRLGGDQVIKGLSQGVEGMKTGGRRRLFVPPNLAYGERGVPGHVPPNAELVIDVDLDGTVPNQAREMNLAQAGLPVRSSR